MKKVICILIGLIVLAGVGDTHGQMKLMRGRYRATKERQIKGSIVNEVLSKYCTIREARSMFSGYTMKDNTDMINAKFRSMKKK